jgi:hypothetical protein
MTEVTFGKWKITKEIVLFGKTLVYIRREISHPSLDSNLGETKLIKLNKLVDFIQDDSEEDII